MQVASFNMSEILFISVDAGEDVIEVVKRVITERNIKDATLLSCFGTFDYCKMHWITTTDFPPVEHFQDFSGPFETLSLCGNIVNGEPHFHVTISDAKGAYGGHLHVGRVLYICEFTLGILDGPPLSREILPDKKIPRLVIGQND